MSRRCTIASTWAGCAGRRMSFMPAATSLETALALVMAADADLVTQSGLGASALSLRCYEVQELLRECAPLGPVEPASETLSVLDALHRAVQVLDAIPVDERPVRLGPAQAELAAALLDAQQLAA